MCSPHDNAIRGACAKVTRVSSSYGQIDAMQWTPYMDNCLELLVESKECPSDEVFIHQVRLQLISREVENAKGTPAVPTAFILQALQSRLDVVKASVSREIQQDGEFEPVRAVQETMDTQLKAKQKFYSHRYMLSS
jgi:hypothetical protein